MARLCAGDLAVPVAGMLACLLDPVVDFLGREHVPRIRAIFVVFVVASMIVLGLFASVAPQLVVEAHDLAATSSAFSTRLPAEAGGFTDHPPKWLTQQIAPLLRACSESARPLASNDPPDVVIETNTPVPRLELPAAPCPTGWPSYTNVLPGARLPSSWSRAVAHCSMCCYPTPSGALSHQPSNGRQIPRRLLPERGERRSARRRSAAGNSVPASRPPQSLAT